MRAIGARLVSEHGMVLVLIALCLFFSYVTWTQQHPNGAAAGRALARAVIEAHSAPIRVLVVARTTQEDAAFAQAAADAFEAAGVDEVQVVKGDTVGARRALDAFAESGTPLDVIVCNASTASWPVFEGMAARSSVFERTVVMAPRTYWWPNFLKAENLLNIANQIAVIAILAVGMTLVIITGGIDLSVGSLIALSAVVCAWLIRETAGAETATPAAMVACGGAAILLCGAMGVFSGFMITLFAIPPFIVTLGMMLVASGLAYILAEGQSIYEIPESFTWLGHGNTLFAIPNAVVLTAMMYLAAHVLMTQTAFGRQVYAVGGNIESARLSGVPVRRVLVIVYTVCGATAGLGGVVLASQLRSGAPTYGAMYELYVIAAVVVGGTSLRGGEGRVLGTLVGALIIAVISNGMNLTGVEPYTQKVVLGLVILGAVLLDVLKNRGWRALWGTRRSHE